MSRKHFSLELSVAVFATLFVGCDAIQPDEVIRAEVTNSNGTSNQEDARAKSTDLPRSSDVFTTPKPRTDVVTGIATGVSTATSSLTGTKTGGRTSTGTNTSTGSRTQTVTYTNSKTSTGSNTSTSSKTLIGTSTQTNSKTQTGTGTRTNSGTGTNTGTKTSTGSVTNAGSCSQCPAGTQCFCCSGNLKCVCTVECSSDDECGRALASGTNNSHCNSRSTGKGICAPDGYCNEGLRN